MMKPMFFNYKMKIWILFPYGISLWCELRLYFYYDKNKRSASEPNTVLQILEKYTMITIIGTFIITNGKECCTRVSIQCSLHQVIGKSKVKDNIIDLFSGGT